MKRLILITGASRGIGKAIATELNLTYNSDAHFVLIARDVSRLGEVRTQMEKESNYRNKIQIVSVDFAIVNEVSIYFNVLKDTLNGTTKLDEFDELIVVYNHGTLIYGNVSLTAQEELRENFEINLFSVWSLLAAINLLVPDSVIKRQFHVNISSGYSHEATANWSGHCCARSARDMLFRCFALEHPELRVLNYEPGIVNTDMFKQAAEVESQYKEIGDQDKYIRPEQTARCLIRVLEENKFPNGGKEKYANFYSN